MGTEGDTAMARNEREALPTRAADAPDDGASAPGQVGDQAAQGKQSVGDSTAEKTQAAPEAKTPSVPQAGDQFPWEFRHEVSADDGDKTEMKIPCVATITSVSRDLVWCDIDLVEGIDPAAEALLRRVVGFPRHIHVLMGPARKALNLPAA